MAHAEEAAVTTGAVWRALRKSWGEGWGAKGPTPAFFTDVDFPSHQVGFAAVPRSDGNIAFRSAVGDPTILRTEDGGRTWATVLTADGGVIGAIGGLDFIDVDTGLAVREDTRNATSPRARILRTRDSGATWTPVYMTAGTLPLRSVAFATTGTNGDYSDAVAVAVGDNGVVLRSENGGAGWERVVDPDIPATVRLNAVAFVPGTTTANGARGVAVGDSGTVLYTDDGGKTWSAASPASVSLRGVAFARDGETTLGIAVGDRGTILHSADGGQTWSDQNLRTPFTPLDAQRAQTHPALRGVALEDTTPGPVANGGLVGYVVGDRLTVLEMQDQQGLQWALAPVDARTPHDPAAAAAVIQARDQRLTAVAVGMTGGEVAALAAGEYGAMLKRTTVDPEHPEEFLAEASSDPWATCNPSAAVGDPSACPVGPQPQGIADPFGPTPAEECGPGTKPEEQPEIACRWTWQPLDELKKEASGTGGALFLDDVDDDGDGVDDSFVSKGRRVVLVRTGKDGATRVFLFDPDRRQQAGIVGFGAGFVSLSRNGAQTGVINLKHAPVSLPDPLVVGKSAYDGRSHRLFLASTQKCDALGTACQVHSPSVVALSLTGQFAPTTTVLRQVEEANPGRTNYIIRSLAYDPRHEMLYVLTETDPYHDRVFSFPKTTLTAPQATLHAFDAGLQDDPDTPENEAGQIVSSWSVPLEGRCRAVREDLPFLGVSRDGDSLAFACQGHSFPHFGSPTFESHKVVTVELKLGGRHPRQLDGTNPTDVAVHLEPIGGRVLGQNSVTFGIEARNLLAWRQPQGVSLWDYERRGWIGAVPFPNILDGSGDLATGRLYFRCQGCIKVEGSEFGESGLLVVDTINLPVDKINRQVVVSLASRPLVVSPLHPQDRPLLFGATDESAINIYEDRIEPAIPRRRPDPDVDTHDIDETEAGSVTRVGRATAYGARLWWTGFTSSLPGGCHPADPNACDIAFTYDWLFDPTRPGSNPTGPHLSAVPSPPAAGAREVRFGVVERAALENANAAAKARSLFYDGGPAESAGNTGDDLKRRRGIRDLHDFLDAESAAFCASDPRCAEFHRSFDGQFGPFEVHFDEALDRAMREFDGDRRNRGGCGSEQRKDDPKTPWNEEDCFAQFDEHDPRDDPETEEDERRGLEHELGVTYASECLDPGAKDDQFTGSHVACDHEDGRTQAGAALSELSLLPSEEGAGGHFSVGSTGSDVDIVRDPVEGTVVEVSAFATDVELSMAGQGSLSIGEVRTTARARAKGRPGTASSWVDVAYEDVVIKGPNGEERVACGQADPASGSLAPDRNGDGKVDDKDADRNGDGKPDEKDAVHALGATDDPRFGVDRGHDGTKDPDRVPVACDPRRVVDTINAVFTDKVRATTSAPDTDPETTGSDGGAQAIVQRDPIAVMSDQVINRIQGLLELPGLQLTVYNDGLRPNRVQIDLAAVYAEAKYFIGAPRTEELPEPGAIEVELSDHEGNALAGGAFVVLEDADSDGALGASDVLVAECTTDETGTCHIEDLLAGDYLVEQRSAPPGYLRQEAPAAVTLAEGSEETVSFVNVPDGAGVEVTLVDTMGRALQGGRFALVADANADRKVSPTDTAVVSCTTGGSGTCKVSQVPLGAYVLHQEAAPRGYKTAADVPFALTRPGQMARIKVVNGTGVAGADVEIIEISGALPAVSSDGNSPSWLARLPKSLADILLRDPLQALLFALTGLLFGAPAYLAHRRRELALAKGGTFVDVDR